MNSYQKYLAHKYLSDGENVLIDYKDYFLCENCNFSIDDKAELYELIKILSAIEADSISVNVLIYYDVQYFYADMICIMGNINDISEKFSGCSFVPEILKSSDEIYLEDYNCHILLKRTQSEINLKETDCIYLYWE